MKTIEEFFKNRIIDKFVDMITNLSNHNFKLKNNYECNSKEINPLTLNITNSIDLIEKLKPLLYFTVSYLEKFKNVNNHNPHDTLEIKASFYSRHRGFSGEENLFEIKFKFDHLTHENIFRKIHLRIKNIIKKIILILFLIPNLLKQLLLSEFFDLMLKLEEYDGLIMMKEDYSE